MDAGLQNLPNLMARLTFIDVLVVDGWEMMASFEETARRGA
jgi:hypothetical protein